MSLDVPAELHARASRWAELKRWERRELGQDLRRLGLSYREIMELIPVAQGTLSGWCRSVVLPPEVLAGLRDRRPSHIALIDAGRRRSRRNDERIDALRAAARREAVRLAADPAWVAGVVAYWSEGSKRGKPELRFANSDPGLVTLFLDWARAYLHLDGNPFDATLHLHDDQDETERKAFWSKAAGIPLDRFRKSFIKREGTGHRKNVLYNGTISIRIRRSGALFHRVMGWIEGLKDVWAASSTG